MTDHPPLHGGRLNTAARRWGIPADQWLDLSTGINPLGWKVPEIPAEVWRRLPEEEDDLEDIIRIWAGAQHDSACVPVPGSQAAIQALPFLRKPCRVGIPEPGYREHGYWWAKAGHHTVPVPLSASRGPCSWLDSLDVLVWIHPNNPTGLMLSPEQLLSWHQKLATRGGWLVLDEAFMDADPASSLAPMTGSAYPGLVVLRSLGKFFGLAGARGGAVLTDNRIAASLRQALGPWPLSGPTRFIMGQALRDSHWQADTAAHLIRDIARLDGLLAGYGLASAGGTPLFRYVPHPRAGDISEALARQGILVRSFQQPPALRIGLPGNESQWQRLRQALAHLESH